MLRNIFFHKNIVEGNTPPSRFLKEKHRSAKSYVSKVLFPDMEKSLTGNVCENFNSLYMLEKFNFNDSFFTHVIHFSGKPYFPFNFLLPRNNFQLSTFNGLI